MAGHVEGGGPSALVKRGGHGGRTGGEGSVAWGIAHVCQWQWQLPSGRKQAALPVTSPGYQAMSRA